MKNQQHNETADDELSVCVYVRMCICLHAVFCLEFTRSDELDLTQES